MVLQVIVAGIDACDVLFVERVCVLQVIVAGIDVCHALLVEHANTDLLILRSGDVVVDFSLME